MTSLFHQPSPGWAETDNGHLVLGLHIMDARSEVSAWVRTAPDNEEVLTVMTRVHGELPGQWFEARIPLDQILAHTPYLFKIRLDGQPACWLASDGLHRRMPPRELQFRWAHEPPPDWVARQVFYQVLPDRFRNGDSSLNLKDRSYRYLGMRDARSRDWYNMPQQTDGPNEFFHGDLPGVTQSLAYLQDRLGVTAVYLNPVFHSDSNHKYDTIDYYQVDARLGGDEALIELRETTRARGMRLLLDGVLNHTSVLHDWFQRARAGEAPYRDYYLDPQGDYASWKGHKSLPVLDYSNPDVVTHCYAGDQSVLRHWLRPPYHIDGWRMDVIHMLGEGTGADNNAHHVAAMRRVIKSENPDAYLLGEHFFEATQWLQGDQEDAAMNYYGFMHPLWMFLAGVDLNRDPGYISGQDLAHWMREARARIPFAMARCQFNLFDSHDTPRLLTLLAGNEQRFVQAVRLQMAYLGVPCLYYGDEVGLEGGEDPENRRTFPWDESRWNQRIFQACQQAIRWRHAYPVLTEGGVLDLDSGEDHWLFARVSRDGAALVGVNRGERDLTLTVAMAELPVSGDTWLHADSQSALAMDNGQLTLHLPAESTELWIMA